MKKKILLIFSLIVVLPCTLIPGYKILASNSYVDMARRISDSEIIRNPQGWMIDFSKTPRWNYTHGVICKAFLDLWQVTGEKKYFEYVRQYADTAINKDGSIGFNYKMSNYNLDHVNPGKMLFRLYGIEKDEKYIKALHNLYNQLESQPRTNEGGFWHKKVYEHQMWLDGLYMATPFLAEYGSFFNDKYAFDEVVRQITLIANKTYDKNTGLYTHGWDESKNQAWCDSITGKSHNFWGRSVGWYLMSMVDALDFLPAEHKGRPLVISIFKDLCNSLIKYQDEETGLWYQLLDLADRKNEGNYLESSCSTMFVYSFVKGFNMGYLDESYYQAAMKGYIGLISNCITDNNDGTLSVTKTCSVAGLGGTPYRDGSFEYYIGEPVRKDDPKATGPFIMACIELSKAGNKTIK